MRETVATQMRLPADIHEYIRQEAARLGIAQNAMLLILLDRGRKLWEAEVNLQPEER